MRLGTAIVLLALGAILTFAVEFDVSGIDIRVVGWILMIVGALGAVLSTMFWSSWGGFTRGRTTVIERDRELL